MRKMLLYCFIGIIVCGGCKKNGNDVTIHCDNLVNDPNRPGDPGNVFVATAFTPNSDGINDQFRPVAIQISSISVRVYDKNSNLVFQTTQIGAGWTFPATLPINTKYYFRVEAVTMANNTIGLCGEVYPLSCFPANINTLKFEDQLTPFGFTGVTSESLSNCN